MTNSLPAHYRSTVRAFVRFSLIGIAVGMILGIWWTDYRKKVRYTSGPPALVKAEGSKVEVELPPGLHFEAGLNLKLSHGHAILIMGVLPLCFAASLYMAHGLGGREVPAGALKASFWLYAVGAMGAVGLLIYRGASSFTAIRGGEFDMQAIQAGLFGGSRAIKGAAYGITHTLMAVGGGILIYYLWRAFGPPPTTTPTAADPAPAEGAS